MATRLGLRAVRSTPAVMASRPAPAAKMAYPTILRASASIAASSSAAATTPAPPPASERLVQQRLRRPVSPNMSIYKIDQVWFGASAWERITGCLLSGGMYAYATAYLAAPVIGWHLESASLAAAFGALPVLVKGGLKFLVAWPFAFHMMNGVRHLVWDLATGFKKSTINRSGWAIWGASLVFALGLGFVY